MKDAEQPISSLHVYPNKEIYNPFPGLRPFGVDESHLFFGRDGQSDEVLYNLAKNKFVAILGASGGGKSSLVYCGLLPVLHGGFFTKTGSAWQIIVTRPGHSPIGNLAASISASLNQSEDDYFNNSLTASILRSSSMGLVDVLSRIFKFKKNILIFIDQYEELFRYRKDISHNDAVNETYSFIKLLTEAVNQTEVPIYIVMTMRSDFIGECAQYQELSYLINKSHYLIPQMTRVDLEEAITGPIAVAGGAISTHLLHQLLNDIGDNPDQLPILQHALMRTWDYWIKHRVGDEPIEVSHYQAIGGIEKALSEHANEAYNELSPRGKEICVSVFKTLTEKGSDNRGIRRPTTVKDLALISRCTDDEVIEVIDKFRKAGRSFLAPPAKIHLTSDTVIDLSHESLMRIWDKLKLWVEEEAASVQMYLRLAESASQFQEGKVGLWRPPDLHLAVNWKLKQQPVLTWALRYEPSFERAMSFLEASEKEFEAEEQNKMRLQKRALKRSRIFALVLGCAAVLSLGFMLYSQVLKVEAEKQKLLAIRQKKAAEKQKLLADKETYRAEIEALISKQKSTEAFILQDMAKEQSEIAKEQKMQAEIQKNKAIEFANQANYQKLLADSSATVAYREKLNADAFANNARRAETKAYELRLLSIAQSMAVKSLQIDKDKSEKGLVAYQAYLFNNKYKGQQFNPDIYNGLFSALKAFRGRNFNHISAHSASVRAIVFSPSNNVFYSAGNDGRIIQWNLKDSTYKKIIAENKGFNTCLAISINGRWLACGTDSLIQVFDLQNLTGSPNKVLRGHGSNIWSLVFTPDCKNLFSSSEDKTVLAWSLESGEKKVFVRRSSSVRGLSVTADGKNIIGGTSDGELILWNRYTKDSVFLQRSTKVAFNALSVSPDGSMLATADNGGNIKVWNTSFRRVVANLSGHITKISDIKFSNNNEYLASASFDGSIRVWNTDNFNYQPLVLKEDEKSWVWAIAFSTDNNTLLSGMKSNNIIKWPINIKIISDAVSNALTRNMSLDEWTNYVAKDVIYEKTFNDLPYGKGVTAESLQASNTRRQVSVSDVVYKVQFAVSKKPITLVSSNFNGLEGVEMVKDGDNYKYLIGTMKSLEEAMKLQRVVQGYGYKETFCVAMKNGRLIPLSDSKKN